MKINKSFFQALAAMLLMSIGCAKSGATYTGRVVEIRYENVLVLDNGHDVALAGVYIPRADHDANYQPELAEGFMYLMTDREIRYRILASASRHYPVYDLIEVLEPDGSSLNEQLVREGKVFFDRGYYPGHRRFEQLEDHAKKNRRGIWAKKDDLKLLFVGKQNWERYHYPECPLVQDIEPDERIEFFIVPPGIHGFRAPDIDCSYCRGIEERENRPNLFSWTAEELDAFRKERKDLERNRKAWNENMRTKLDSHSGPGYEN